MYEYQYVDNLDRFIALSKAKDYSTRIVSQLARELKGKLSANIDCVAICGSLARFEASEASDIDYIIFVKNSSKAQVGDDNVTISKIVQDFGMSLPNPKGAFAKPCTNHSIINHLGNNKEKSDDFTKRMLMLMESCPVYGDSYDSIIDRIFDRYTDKLKKEPRKEFTLLLNDLIRYFRFICLNYEDNFWGDNKNWALRNIKLRHSRVLIYMGLLALLGEASKIVSSSHLTRREFLREKLSLTPLDRIAFSYKENRDGGSDKVIGLYNSFLDRIADKNTRDELRGLKYEDRYSNQKFAELKANSDAFISELTRFIFARKGQWSDRFIEYLFF